VSEMRPLNDKEIRDAAKRLRPQKEAHETETLTATREGYEMGVRWACEQASYQELMAYIENSSLDVRWMSQEMAPLADAQHPESARAGFDRGVETVWNALQEELSTRQAP
jgi:hypothetical protein